MYYTSILQQHVTEVHSHLMKACLFVYLLSDVPVSQSLRPARYFLTWCLTPLPSAASRVAAPSGGPNSCSPQDAKGDKFIRRLHAAVPHLPLVAMMM